ncbi:MAG: DUF3488 and transglutaminase-like domain-containing protein [Elusimicrobia bacterium]|nr:DUF3488 and transglutaminase-like domain-containing protein [Candidatus Obscuribacterium magneticum]
MKNNNVIASPLFTPRSVVRSVRVLSAMGAIALASTGELEWLFLSIFTVFFLIGLKLDDVPRISRWFGLLQPYLAVLCFGYAVFDFFRFSQSFLLSVAHFLLNVQALRLLSLRTVRENVGSVLLSSMMILSAATLAVEWTFFVILFVFLLAATWTVILLNLVQERERGQVATCDIFHKCRMSRLDPERSPFWRNMIPIVRFSTGVAFVVSVFCCAVVFIGFPRLNLQGFRGKFLQPVRKTGFASQVDLGKTGKIFIDDAVTIRVLVSPSERKFWDGYLRGGTLDLFDGRFWKKSVKSTTRVFRGEHGSIALPIPGTVKGRLFRQIIYLESMDSPLLFAAWRPVRFKIDRPFLEGSNDGSLSRRTGDMWRISYEVESALPEKGSSRDIRLAAANRDLTPSPSPFPIGTDESRRRILQLTRDIVKSEKSPFGAAKRIETYLKTAYSYTLDAEEEGVKGTERGDNRFSDPLSRFLFVGKKGHCELFASAMCVMLRLTGIPARLVNGFLAHEWNDKGNYYIVRMKDAHAWVEAYVEPFGWTRFDPTPRDWALDGLTQNWMNQLRNTMDVLNLQWNRYILSYDLERQVEIVGAVTIRSKRLSFRLDQIVQWTRRLFVRKGMGGPSDRQRPPGNGWRPGWGFLIFALSGAFLVAGALLLIRFRRRQKQSVWFYRKVVRFLERKGAPRSPSLTLRELAGSVKEKLRKNQSDVEFLASEYYRLRFNPSTDMPVPTKKSIRSILKRLR